MLSSSANTAFTNRIRNSMGQIPCHGMSAPPAVTVVICYPCCRYILLPILPVRTDIEGNVYCTGPGGVWIINAAREHLGTILLGDRVATNVAFGGENWASLFITTYNELGRIHIKIPGVPVPRGNL